MFDREQIRVFENYLQKIIERPRTIDSQPHIRKNGFLWCDDWRIIEILKYLINGREMYIGDPPPNRLKNNPLWTKDMIMCQAEELLTIYLMPDAIVNHLRTERDKSYDATSA